MNTHQRPKVPPFILQLLDILNNPEFAHLIAWKEDGTMFTIKDPQAFMAEIVPQYFNQTTFKSFTRQLNMYDFHKFRLGHEQGLYFYHPFFQRRKPHLLSQIIRQSHSSHPKREQKRQDKLESQSMLQSSFQNLNE